MGTPDEAPAADVTMAVAHADFKTGGAESGVRWAGPRGAGAGVEVDSELESLPRLAAERASAEAWWVKPESFAMKKPRSDWCGILPPYTRYL